MTKKTFHKTKFDKGTQTKLEVFKEYFKESFPVFLHSPAFDEILIYDFFAGQGKNSDGEYGTAFNILNELKPYCDDIKKSKKKIYLVLNDKEQSEVLKSNVNDFFDTCKSNCQDNCFLKLDTNFVIKSEDFNTYFKNLYPKLVQRKKSAKLIYLDPFTFIIDTEIFQNLSTLQNTDFICFIPSFYLKRFPETPSFNKFIDTQQIKIKEAKAEHCHRLVASYYDSLIPKNKEYYIGCFSVKKDTGYYGLIFGSNHSFGAEKFQKVCWKIDEVTGEADYNIDRELTYGNQLVLFEENAIPEKIQKFNQDLISKIFDKSIKTDVEAYKFALSNRCLVKHAADILKDLIKSNQIQSFKTTNNDIHKIKEPTLIKVI